MAPIERIGAQPAAAQPLYELRVRRLDDGGEEYEIWQVRSPSTPQLSAPLRVAGLYGDNLELVRLRVLRFLQGEGVKPRVTRHKRGYPLSEDAAINLGLLFRVLAPMRSRPRMRQVVDGIDEMETQETAYWLGMAMYRHQPRRVLTALRFLLTSPT